MKFRLVFPPMWRPVCPYPSVPCLVAYLRREGIDCEGYDLSLEFFDYVLSSDYLRACAQALKGSKHDALYAYLVENVEPCKATLRSEAALDPEVYKSCNALLDSCLKLISKAWGNQESLGYTSYAISGYGVNRSTDLQRCVRDVLTGRLDSRLLDVLSRFVDPIVDDAQLVGFSVCNNSQLLAAYMMAALCKQRKPSVKIVLGGITSTAWSVGEAHLEYLFDAVDYYSFYEGEIPLTLLCRHLAGDAGVALSDVPGLAYLSDGKLTVNPYSESVSMDALPTPDYDPHTLHRYFSPVPVLSMFTSRGCFWNQCTFCAHAAVSHDCYRVRSIDKVIEDIEKCYYELGVRYFDFNDEAITAATYRKLSQRLIGRKLDIRWRAYARFDKTMTPETIRLAARAGLRRLHLGLESYNERVLKLMNKGIDRDNVLPILRAASEAGIWNHVYLIRGFPTETMEEFDETFSFIAQNRQYVHSVSCGSYALTLFSAVAMHPEQFGICIAPRNDDDLPAWTGFTMREGVENTSFEAAQKESYRERFNQLLSPRSTDALRFAGVVFSENALQERRVWDALGADYADSSATLLFAADGEPCYAVFPAHKDKVVRLPEHLLQIMKLLQHCRSKKELLRALETRYGYPAPLTEQFLSQL